MQSPESNFFYKKVAITTQERKFLQQISDMLSEYAKKGYDSTLDAGLQGTLPRPLNGKDMEFILKSLVADMIVQRFPRLALVYEQDVYSQGTFPPQLRKKIREESEKLELSQMVEILTASSDEIEKFFAEKIDYSKLRWKTSLDQIYADERTKRPLESNDIADPDPSKQQELANLFNELLTTPELQRFVINQEQIQSLIDKLSTSTKEETKADITTDLSVKETEEFLIRLKNTFKNLPEDENLLQRLLELIRELFSTAKHTPAEEEIKNPNERSTHTFTNMVEKDRAQETPKQPHTL
jgi:hypothetical protein